jgi:hypothetical protein
MIYLLNIRLHIDEFYQRLEKDDLIKTKWLRNGIPGVPQMMMLGSCVVALI